MPPDTTDPAPPTGAAPARPVTVALVDDHPTIRAGTRAFLTEAGHRVVAEAATIADTHRLLAAEPPAVLVLDLNLTDGNALRHLPAFRQLAPTTGVLVLSMHDEIPVVRAALDAGAAGYLPKTASAAELSAAVTAIAAGQVHLPAELATRLARPTTIITTGPLTDRERTALRLWAAGHTNAHIATTLGVSLRSVERLRASLAARLGLTTRADFATYTRTHLR